MAITTSTPIVVQATAEKTFTKMWIQNLNVRAPSPTERVNIYITLVPYDETTGEMSVENTKSFLIEDALTLAATDANLATTLNSIYEQVDRQAKMMGII